MASNEPFKFYTGVGEDNYTGLNALSLIGLIKILEKIDIKAIEFHNNRRDFEEWALLSLRNKKLAKKLRSVSKYKGKLLREKLLQITNKHLMNYYKSWIG